MLEAMIPWLLYIFALSVTLYHAFTRPIICDRQREWDAYLYFANHYRSLRHWLPSEISRNLVDSCLTITAIPFCISKITRLSEVHVFKTVPCFFFSFVPVGIYLTSRLVLTPVEALVAALVPLSGFFFLFDSNIGRVGVGLGFFSLLFYSVIDQNIALAILAAIMLIISHYGTAFYATGIIGVMWITQLITGTVDSSTVASFVTLLIGIEVWHRRVVKVTGSAGETFVRATVSGSPLLNPQCARPGTPRPGFFDLEIRDPLVKSAFLQSPMTFPQKVEWLASWVLVIATFCGIARGITVLPLPYVMATIFAGITVIISVVIPHISVFYGVGRTWLTSLVVIAPCFVLRFGLMEETMGGLVFTSTVLIVRGLCISGLAHRMLGIRKRRIAEDASKVF